MEFYSSLSEAKGSLDIISRIQMNNTFAGLCVKSNERSSKEFIVFFPNVNKHILYDQIKVNINSKRQLKTKIHYKYK
jgi:hypothetical protein